MNVADGLPVDPSQYAILQWLGGAALVAIMFLTWVRGQRVEPERPPRRDGGVEIYVDGPLGQANVELRRISAAIEAATASANAIAALREEMSQQIMKNRHDTREMIQAFVARLEPEMENLEKRVREAERTLAIVDDRVNGLLRRPGHR